MRIDIMTLFPDMVASVMDSSIIGRAQDRGFITVRCHNIRDYTKNKQNQVDDYPYGGGSGVVMQADPLFNCLDYIKNAAEGDVHTVYMTPQGKPFSQGDARRLAAYPRLVIVCGHYEGVDERFITECVDEEISLGDFVLTGGEIPAMAVCDAVCRLIPGVLASEEAFTGESHWNGLLEYPQYSRPEIWHGMAVPEVLLRGNHSEITAWRHERSLERTMDRRPDLLDKAELSELDRKFIAERRLRLEKK